MNLIGQPAIFEKKKVFPIVLINLFMVCSAGIGNLPG